MTKIFDGIAKMHESYKLFNLHPLGTPPDEYENEWWEVTEETYDYFMNILPPMIYGYDYYLMSEKKIGNVTSAFLRMDIGGKRYFHGYVDISNITKNLATLRREILDMEYAKLGGSKVHG